VPGTVFAAGVLALPEKHFAHRIDKQQVYVAGKRVAAAVRTVRSRRPGCCSLLSCWQPGGAQQARNLTKNLERPGSGDLRIDTDGRAVAEIAVPDCRPAASIPALGW
jgi:hypothetical protein